MNANNKLTVPHFIGGWSHSSNASTNSSQVHHLLINIDEKVDTLTELMKKLDTKLGPGNMMLAEGGNDDEDECPMFLVNITENKSFYFPSLTETKNAVHGLYRSEDKYGIIWV